MEIINFITENFVMISGFLATIIIAIYALVKKRIPEPTEIAKIIGVSDSVLNLILQIFRQTQYDHVKFNKEMLITPVALSTTVTIPEQKMKVAVQAMNELMPQKTLNKIGDLFDFAQHAYKWLKPLFKSKK